MLRRLAIAGIVAVVAGASLAIEPAGAQVGPGGAINVGRDCQTLRNCRFTTGGVFRGCVSSFSCRTCKMVATRCELPASNSGACQKLRCTWGG